MVVRRSMTATRLATLLLVTTLFADHAARATGNYVDSPFFQYTVHPDFPLEAFAAGKLGVLRAGTLWQAHTVVVYRYLSGGKLGADEQAEAVAYWRYRLHLGQPGPWPPSAWLAARKAFGPLPAIATYRDIASQADNLGCQDDAFVTATRALAERRRRLAAAELAEWVRAQDIVFANCTDGKGRPGPLPAAASTRALADRAYQNAAADFYAGRFRAAAEAFRAIAADAKSPWAPWGNYLVARALIHGRVDPGDSAADKSATGDDKAAPAAPGNDKAASAAPAGDKAASAVDNDALGAAKTLLAPLVADAAAPLHRAALRLANLIAFREQPEQQVVTLGQRLQRGSSIFYDEIADYARLLDRASDEEDQARAQPGSPTSMSTRARSVPLGDWVLTWRRLSPPPAGPGGSPATGEDGPPNMTPAQQRAAHAAANAALAHALARWRRTHALPWLVAALVAVPPRHASAAELAAAAERVPKGSPAELTLIYHRVRLLVAGDAAAKQRARALLDEVLAGAAAAPSMAHNLFAAQRFALAASLDDLVVDGPRQLLGQDSNEAELEVSYRPPDKPFVPRPRFDSDGGAVFRSGLPLGTLATLLDHPRLPPLLRDELAVAVWLRAVMLDDDALAVRLGPRVRGLFGDREWQRGIDAFLAATSAAERNFAAVLLLLRTPGLRPYAEAGAVRTTPFNRLDPFRDNWWAFAREPAAVPAFLAADQRRQAEQEWRRLIAFDHGAAYAGHQVIEYAKQHLDDPRVPEALYRVNEATHYIHSTPGSSRVSREAYLFMHKSFPKSPWTAKVKFWY